MHLMHASIIILLAFACLTRGDASNLVTSLPALGEVNETQYAGYIQVTDSLDDVLFYWFFEAREPVASGEEIPLVIWLNGGPGKLYIEHIDVD